MPRWQVERHPYPNSQLGEPGEADVQEYVDHAHRCWSDPETRVAWLSLAHDVWNAVLPPADRLADLPPTCWVWGEGNRLLPFEHGKRQLDVLKPDEVHVLKGRGYAAAWESPVEVNRIIERFLERHRLLALPDGRRLDAAHIAFP